MSYLELKKRLSGIFETPVRNVSVRSQKINGISFDTFYVYIENETSEKNLVVLGYHDGVLIWVRGEVLVGRIRMCEDLLFSVYGGQNGK